MRIRGLHGRLRVAVVATALIAFGFGARAAPSCKGLSTSPVAFGSYNPVSAAPTDSVGTISYFCPGALSPVISISAGSAGSFSPRGMVGADVLGYNLYADAARTVVWGDGTSGSVTVPGVTSTNPATANIYGRIFPLQSVSAGSYSDTLIVTINF
jgi:spore coat protein U-like protein